MTLTREDVEKILRIIDEADYDDIRLEVGDRISHNDTVCLVEVMKLFNSINAGVAGTVVKILVEDSTMVE